jgi:hypothetical protein
MVAAFLGFVNLENARRGLILRPLAIFWALVAGYLFFVNGTDLAGAAGSEALAGFALLFCAVSPLLGWLWWGRGGKIRRGLLRTALFLLLTAGALLAWSAVLGTTAAAVGLAVLTGFLPFLGLGKRWQRLRSRWQFSQQRRHQRRQARHQAALERQQAQHAERERRNQARVERALVEREREAAILRSSEERRVAALASQRLEVAEQVHLLRTAEVDRIRQGDAGLRFHPHFGFLMAEGWRVLRAQIARGERIPPAEHDTFFHQVIAELLEPADFAERYFHESGRQAMAALHRYLLGATPLAPAREAIRQLGLVPAQLAPEPLPEYLGAALLEAWLVPHRRYQQSCYADFREGRHPRQEQILAFLRERAGGLPSPEEWRGLWDEHPALFMPPGPELHSTSATNRGSSWWREVSNTWRGAKAR